LDITKYTPYRANQLDLLEITKDKRDFLTPRKTMMDEFITKFWSSCRCIRGCFTQVSIKRSLETYEYYNHLGDNEKSVSIGALVKNMDITGKSNDPRTIGLKKSYEWTVQGSKVCKPFFMFVHKITRKQLGRLEDCNKKDIEFEIKKKGNNSLSFDLYEQLYKFLKTYFELHVQPNPQGLDKHLLPSSFSLREVYHKFCDNYRSFYNTDKDPLCWKTFNDYYKAKFPFFKQLTKNTDFCDLYCRLKQTIIDKKAT